jgi:glycosyltransferase involved in cell wall biosynthesis
VARAVPDVRFLIVGSDANEPGYKGELERLAARLNLTTNVWFLGERKDVAEVLKEADLFVLPSLSEGLSNVLLEAMVAKLPIVATNVGGNPEVVEQDKTGLLVPAKDAGALARGLCQMLSNRELAIRFGEAGRRRVATHFSLQDMVNQTQELYLSLLECDHPRPAAA